MKPPQFDPDERVFRRWFHVAVVVTIAWLVMLAILAAQAIDWVQS